MRDRLAHGEADLMAIERTITEHHVQQLTRGNRLRGGGQHGGQALGMMFIELTQPRPHIGEGPAVRGQHQRVRMQQIAKLPACVQEQRQRIGFRLGLPDTDIGADRRQNLVAGNQDTALGAIQRDMLGRMPLAAHHHPGIAIDHQPVALGNAPMALGQAHAIRIQQHLAAKLLDQRGIEAVQRIVQAAITDIVGVGVAHGQIGGKPFGLRHARQQSAPVLRHEARVAGMIGMEMRHHQAVDPPPAQHPIP